MHAHLAIRRRIDEVLGPVSEDDSLDTMRRMCLPWMLYERVARDQPNEVTVPAVSEVKQLAPLPATLRSKGLTRAASRPCSDSCLPWTRG